MHEWAKEKTNERASKRIEQRFMNEILSKTREIEENSFSGTAIGCSSNFYRILRIAINNYAKKQCNVRKKSNENL